MPTGSSEAAVTHAALMGTDPAVEIRQAVRKRLGIVGPAVDAQWAAVLDAAVRVAADRERAARELRDEVVGKLQRENERLRANIAEADSLLGPEPFDQRVRDVLRKVVSRACES